ncbi:MAG: hypothetical protein ABFS02_09055 [Pseudomonadota bacterium]
MKKLSMIAVLAVLVLGGGANTALAEDGNSPVRAVTLWWVIFNSPDACTANPGGLEQCGSVDVFGQAFLESVANGAPDPSLIAPNLQAGLAVLYATGGVTDPSGRITLAASIYRSEDGQPLAISNAAAIADPMGLGAGYSDTDAEVHLVVRDHGRRVPAGEIQQISSFLDPYCSDPNLLYFAGQNVCADAQFAIFGPDESGSDVVMAFGNPPSEVNGASAYLIRNGDAIQVIVRTRLANH